MKIKCYEDLVTWKKSIEFTQYIYQMTKNSNFIKDRPLCDQMRRSSVSIASNIAEGFERNGNKEFIRFLVIAKGSAGEIRTQIMIAYKIGYITEKEYKIAFQLAKEISSLLGGFITYLKRTL